MKNDPTHVVLRSGRTERIVGWYRCEHNKRQPIAADSGEIVRCQSCDDEDYR